MSRPEVKPYEVKPLKVKPLKLKTEEAKLSSPAPGAGGAMPKLWPLNQAVVACTSRARCMRLLPLVLTATINKSQLSQLVSVIGPVGASWTGTLRPWLTKRT